MRTLTAENISGRKRTRGLVRTRSESELAHERTAKCEFVFGGESPKTTTPSTFWEEMAQAIENGVDRLRDPCSPFWYACLRQVIIYIQTFPEGLGLLRSPFIEIDCPRSNGIKYINESRKLARRQETPCFSISQIIQVWNVFVIDPSNKILNITPTEQPIWCSF